MVNSLLERQNDNPAWLPSYRDVIYWFESRSFSSLMWRQFCYDRERPVFELLTQEFITALGSYMAERVKSLRGLQEQPLTILEVGAGNGRLAYFLQQLLYALIPGQANIVATDSGAWKSILPIFPVERLNYRKALCKYQPRIVLCAWMPYQQDWTAAMRTTPSVKEYILIGEADDGCCGHSYRTWGSSTFSDTPEIKAMQKCEPPYKAAGFQRWNLAEMSHYQLCRSDYPDSYPHSKTVSFRGLRWKEERKAIKHSSRDFLDREKCETRYGEHMIEIMSDE